MCDAAARRLAEWLRQAMRPAPRLDPLVVLPLEVMHLVWVYLPLEDLLSASLVSTSWHAALTVDNVWKNFCKEKEKRPEATWRSKFLAESSLVHNWARAKYHTCIKTPVTGKVVSGDKAVVLYKDRRMDVYSGECVLVKSVEVSEEVEQVWCPREGRHVVVVVRSAQEREVRLYEWGSLREAWRRRVPWQAQVRCSATQLAVCSEGRLLLVSTEDWTEHTLSLPDCKAVTAIHLLTSAPLLRLEPLDNNYETVYSLYSGDWTVVHKSPRNPLGARQFFEFCHGDYFLLVNCLFVDEAYMYSNVHLYRGKELLSRAIVSNCRTRYFEATFTEKTLLFSVADYRLTAVDLITLRPKEVYVRPGFDGLFSVLGRYFVLTYRDKMEVWDYFTLKRLYSVPLIENDRVQVKDDFVAITSWPCSSLPLSLRILNYKEPTLAP